MFSNTGDSFVVVVSVQMCFLVAAFIQLLTQIPPLCLLERRGKREEEREKGDGEERREKRRREEMTTVHHVWASQAKS